MVRRWSSDGVACLIGASSPPGDPLSATDDKYLGAAVGDDGCIYAIPGTAREVLRIDPRSDSISKVGDTRGGFVTNALQRKRFKWLRGVSVGQAVYGIPANADRVVKLSTRSGKLECVGPMVCPGRRWKYHGAVVSSVSRRIVCIPACADRVLLIDDEKGEVREIGPVFKGEGKWYGGLLLAGKAYGIPFNHDKVLRIDIETEEVDLVGPSLGEGGYKWHGGVRARDAIVGVPSHSDSVLVIDSNGVVSKIDFSVEMSPFLRTNTLESSRLRFRKPGRYKYGGGVAVDNVVFCFPYDAHLPLRVDVQGIKEEHDRSCVVTTMSRVDEASREDFHGYNKWQNGFVSRVDGCVYAIPVSACGVLKIDPVSEIVSTVARDICESTVSAAAAEKWEGGAVDPSTGALYAVPQGSRYVLKIDPPDTSTEELETYEGAISIRLVSTNSVKGFDLVGNTEDHTGLFHWPARILVCRWLVSHRDSLQKMKLLELGCGSGGCAALAAKCGLDLVATDFNEKCLEIARINVSKNTATASPPALRHLRWGDRVDERFDLVFASDVVYPDGHDRDLEGLFDTARSAAPTFILAFYDRGEPGVLSKRLFSAAHRLRCSASFETVILSKQDSATASDGRLIRFCFDDERPEPRGDFLSKSSPLFHTALEIMKESTGPTRDVVGCDRFDESPFPSDVCIV